MPDLNLIKQVLEATRNEWNRPGTRPAVRKGFAAVLDCGTATLGWELYVSDTEEKRCYHRCKSRFCSSCGYRATLLWLERQEAALPDIQYTSIVFTMPHELWSIFRRNRHLLHDLPALGAEVIQQWIRIKYGVRVLVIVVPHTFGGDLKFNCHLHVLISAGGLDESSGRWIPRLRLEKDGLMRDWRRAVMDHLQRALRSGVLKSKLGTEEAGRLLSIVQARHPRWIIFLDRIASKAHFLRYAARYVRRPPIASWRLLRVSKQHIDFLAKDTKAGVMVRRRCALPDFVRLLAAHVPDVYRHAIRYFGLLAPRAKDTNWTGLFITLGQEMRVIPPRLSWRDSLVRYFGVDPLTDGRGHEMHWVRRERSVAI